MAVYTTACPRNCYSTCSLRVHVEDGRIRRIEPHTANEATGGGACLKGLSYFERVHSPDRLLCPLRRRPSGGGFGRITWDEALDTIAEKLQAVRDETGPQSVLYYSASGTKGLLNTAGLHFWRLFGGCTTTYGDLCWPAGLEATRLTLGENKHSDPQDIARARLIVLWGKNVAETNLHQMVFIEQALQNGAKLVVIDPRRTQTAERAELLIQPRPGSDGALALAVAHLLIAENLVAHDFIHRHVLGFSQFAEMVRTFTPEHASAITDVPVPYIHRLAEAFGSLAPVTISAGFGMQRYTNSGQTMRALIALLALTGNIGKPGAGWVYANLQSHIFDAVKDPLAFYPPAEEDGIVRVSVSTARLGRDMLATKDPPLRLAWVERGNPIPQNPQTNTVLQAFRALDFRVVVEQFFTDTAREADIVLPAKTMFEQSDVITAYWHPYIQLKQKVIDPPGEVKPETEIYRLLADRLGLNPQEVAAGIPGPTDAEVEAFLTEKLQPFPDLSLAALRRGPIPAPGRQEVAFSDLRFATPSGKIELVSEEAATRWGVDPVPRYRESQESIRHSAPETQKDPLYFLTPNTKNRIHSQFNNLSMIRQVSEKPVVLMNPDDARARGITAGSMVCVFNDRGRLTLEAQLDYGLKAGCAAVTNGWWLTESGAVNLCSLGRETDLGHGAAFHDNLVQIEAVGRAE